MKKDLIFAPLLFVVSILLCLLKFTGIIGHIVISVVGFLLLGAYTVTTIKNWKLKPIEALMRASYGVALITGIVIAIIKGLTVVIIVHNVAASLFAVLLLVLFIYKLLTRKK